MPKTIFPAPLEAGDKVAILSPASAVKPELVEGAVQTLRAWGLRPVVMPHALGRSGSFAATVAERLGDWEAVARDPGIKAVICSRGGYGCVQLLRALDTEPRFAPLWRQPRWLAGFSDVSALHALWRRRGIASLHASMAKGLARGPREPLNLSLLGLMRHQGGHLQWASGGYDHPGEARGVLVGGNLAVIDALVGTQYDVFNAPGPLILVIEDIAEPIYKVQRILYQLRLAGVLDRLAGLVVGQFTDYRASADYPDMYAMISEMVAGCACPVAFGAPVGHVEGNAPLLLGAEACLEVTPDGSALTFAQP